MAKSSFKSEEVMTLCDSGVETYIKNKNKAEVSNRLNEGMTGAVFATGLYLLFGGVNQFNYKMVLAPFLAGAAYSAVGIMQTKNKDTDYRMAFEQVCSNVRTENDEDADE